MGWQIISVYVIIGWALMMTLRNFYFQFVKRRNRNKCLSCDLSCGLKNKE